MSPGDKVRSTGARQRLGSLFRKSTRGSKIHPTDLAFAQTIAADLKNQEGSAQKPAIIRTDGGGKRAEAIAHALTTICAQEGVLLPFEGEIPVFAQVEGRGSTLFSVRMPEGCSGPMDARVFIVCEGAHRIKEETLHGVVLEEI